MTPSTYYHIFNHANGDENLFREERNYYFFLEKWTKYIEPVANTYAYCLMPNHIHFLIRTKGVAEILNLQGFENLGGLARYEKILSQQFSNLFNSYTKSFNKLYQRRGSLFIPNFKRKEVDNPEYLRVLINYIHNNPVHHRYRDRPEEWPYSSYDAFLSMKRTRLQRKEVLDWLGGEEEFKKLHQSEILPEDRSLLIDY
jgi:putative transposase